MATLPLTLFQIGGHILSSDAMSRIPVSLVHTIKGLSPLLTILAYRIFFQIHYSVSMYLSLIPLTLGIIMACSANFSANFMGLVTAFGSAILFVTQNIVSKKIFNEAEQAEAEGTPRSFSTSSAMPSIRVRIAGLIVSTVMLPLCARSAVAVIAIDAHTQIN